jgi:hypothetical protein
MDHHIVTADPLGLGTVNGVVHLIGLRGGPNKEFHEVLGGAGKYRADGVVTLRPVEVWQISYELLATAELSLAFGVAVNTNYLITGASVNCTNADYPQVTVDVIKPSAANLIKAYDGTVTLTIAGGFGVVNKFGSTSTKDFASSSCTIEMQAIDIPKEVATAGVSDYAVGGIYRYGFKKSCTAQAHAAIVTPVSGAYVTEQPIEESRDGVKLYNASWWEYMDPMTPAA